MSAGYTPRRFDQNPLFQVAYHHFEEFQECYHRDYSERCGAFREIITHTVQRFLLCGDPREGIARYECPRCNRSLFVPFSCKTRLFCPSCHEKKILLWVEEIQESLLLNVPHRYLTFSVPKRLRYYFMRNRKLLGLLVTAANNTIVKSLGEGRATKGIRPGIIALIQTHSDELEFNSHLHLIVTDGTVDYTNHARPKFKPCTFWNVKTMVELFRFELIEAMYNKHILTSEIANNLISWKNSGFHVHSSQPFMPNEGDTLINRLRYSFRPPVTLNRLGYDGKEVTLITTKGKKLTLSPVEFLGKITLHIPNRYQNIRRYAGFYASNIQRKIRLARQPVKQDTEVEVSSPIKPKWAQLIARIFGDLPTNCPKCGTAMNLKEFIMDEEKITAEFPELARAPPGTVRYWAPPKKLFGKYEPPENEIVYGAPDQIPEYEFDQSRPESDDDYNQACPE